MTENFTANGLDGWEFPESYSTFWDAIPVDVVRDPYGSTRGADPTDTNLTADGRVLLLVEQSDVGIG